MVHHHELECVVKVLDCGYGYSKDSKFQSLSNDIL